MIFLNYSPFFRLFFGAICFTNLFKAFEASNILTETEAISFENLFNKINFDEIEIKLESNLRINLVDGYNDARCTQQFSNLKNSFNKSELWAVQGETKYMFEITID